MEWAASSLMESPVHRRLRFLILLMWALEDFSDSSIVLSLVIFLIERWLLVLHMGFCFQFDSFQKEAIQMVKPAKGTTTLAFIFKQGVMVAADSRASMGGYICELFCLINCCSSVILVSIVLNGTNTLQEHTEVVYMWQERCVCFGINSQIKVWSDVVIMIYLGDPILGGHLRLI